MRVRNAVDGSVPPDLRNPEMVMRGLFDLCTRDAVFRSNGALWCAAHPGYDGLDYLHALQKPYRDAGTMPDFPNLASYAAWVLSLPPEMAEGWR